MSPRTHHDLATTMAELVQSVPESGLSFSEALATLDALRQEEPEFSRFLSRRGTRLPAVQQQAFLRLVQAAQATDYIPLLQQWRSHTALSIETRALTATVLAFTVGQMASQAFGAKAGEARGADVVGVVVCLLATLPVLARHRAPRAALAAST